MFDTIWWYLGRHFDKVPPPLPWARSPLLCVKMLIYLRCLLYCQDSKPLEFWKMLQYYFEVWPDYKFAMKCGVIRLPTPYTSRSWKNVGMKNDQNDLHSKVLPLAFLASTTNFGFRAPPIENAHTWLGNDRYKKTYPLQPSVVTWTLYFTMRRCNNKLFWLSTGGCWLRFLDNG